MPLITNRVAVTTTATRLDQIDTVLAVTVMFRNRGDGPVFIGGPGVTTSTGYQLDPGERMRIDLRAADGGVWAVAEAGSQRLDRIQLGGGS